MIDDEKDDPREELGYISHKRQHIPWAHEVKRDLKVRSTRESPLKEWWLQQKEKEKELENASKND